MPFPISLRLSLSLSLPLSPYSFTPLLFSFYFPLFSLSPFFNVSLFGRCGVSFSFNGNRALLLSLKCVNTSMCAELVQMLLNEYTRCSLFIFHSNFIASTSANNSILQTALPPSAKKKLPCSCIEIGIK